MKKNTDRKHLGRHSSTYFLWAITLLLPLVLLIFLEAISLGALYLYNSLSGKSNRAFARDHLLTSLFAPAPVGPVPGKRFLGHLRDDDRWEDFLVPDGLLGWRLGSNLAVYHSPSRHSNEYLYLTDDKGFIADTDDPPVTLHKPADVYRVVMMGGSTVMGDGSPRPSQNLVGMLRTVARDQRITAADGKKVEFINAGVDGYYSSQEYLYFVSELIRYKPDLVIFYDGWNDSWAWNDNSIIKNKSPFRTKTHDEGTRRIEASYTVSGSFVLALGNLKSALTERHFRLGMMELPWRLLQTEAADEAVERRSGSYDPSLVKYYRENHRAIAALADDQLAVAIFLQPLVGTDDRVLSDEEKAAWWNDEVGWELHNRVPFYRDARRVLAELQERSRGQRQVCIADLSDSLRHARETVWADTGHLFPNGNRIVASRILDELASCGLILKRAS